MGRRQTRTRQHIRYEVALRARFLRLALLAAAVIATLYLLQGVVGLIRPAYFPWDGLLGLSLVAICVTLYRRGGGGNISLAASWLVAGVNILAAFYSQLYGVRHPVTAIYLVGIVLGGMLIGGWFMGMWSGLSALFVLLWAVLELSGMVETTRAPLQSWTELAQVVLFWWTLIAATAWLVQHFARNLERAVQVSRAQTAALARTLQALAGEPELATFLREVLTVIAEQLDAPYVTLFFHEADHDRLAVRLVYAGGELLEGAAMDGIAPATATGFDLPIWQSILDSKAPLVIDEVGRDPRLKNEALMPVQGIHTVLYVPLLLEETVVGFFSVNSTEQRIFTAAEIELAQALAQQVTLAMQLTRLAQQQERIAVVMERNRMAREIHDTLAQGFTGILIQLEVAEDILGEDGRDRRDEATAHLARARDLARDSLEEARRSVRALRPQALEDQELPDALREIVARLMRGSGLRVNLEVIGSVRLLPPSLSAELLRIAQEALTNALKHSGAAAVTVLLDYEPAGVYLSVVDDGRGFDAAAVDGGFGLTSMRERAEKIGGSLVVSSEPGGGTRVECRVGSAA